MKENPGSGDPKEAQQPHEEAGAKPGAAKAAAVAMNEKSAEDHARPFTNPDWIIAVLVAILVPILARALTPEDAEVSKGEDQATPPSELRLALADPNDTPPEQLADVARFLDRFAFHPIAIAEALEFPTQALEPESQPLELRVLSILQHMATEPQADFGPAIQRLEALGAERIEVQLLRTLHTLRHGVEEDLAELLQDAPQAGRHLSLPGLLALAYLAGSKPDHAYNTLRTEADHYPHLLADQGMLELLRGHHQKALATLNDVLLIHPELASAHHHRALVLVKLDQAERAIELLQAWVDHIASTPNLTWNPAPREGDAPFLRGSAVYLRPAKSLLLEDPGLDPLWETAAGIRLHDILEQ